MFDTINVSHDTQRNFHEHRTETHEHRAPTDESLRLVNEMREQVKEELLGVYKVEANNITGKVSVFRNLIYDQHEVHVMFTLNGVEYHERHCVPSYKLHTAKQRINAVDLLKHAFEKAVKEVLAKDFVDAAVETLYVK